ncbi:MAG TPA: hotdog fold domain-containing protein [Acidimicrobiales bacterium]|jgi:acyl dehydratase|nr:hotdog fold domain-containing protein [Acidimicrobiales bacterium]
MERYQVRAKNTATTSENKIHDDAVAASLGFSGGLVPGVDVYAYLAHVPAATWGVDWLERGTLVARFVSPVYDGDEVEVVTTARSGDSTCGSLDLEVRDSNDTLCATATAALPSAADVDPDSTLLPLGALPAERPPASQEVFASLDVLGSLELGFHSDSEANTAYLDDIREHHELFRTGGAPHPGWLLRQANRILAANVKLGPWIHVESTCRHLAVGRDGDRISVRARVVGTRERKGHRFVDLDVQWVANGERALMRAAHTAIYQPRGVPASS